MHMHDRIESTHRLWGGDDWGIGSLCLDGHSSGRSDPIHIGITIPVGRISRLIPNSPCGAVLFPFLCSNDTALGSHVSRLILDFPVV